MTIPSNLRAVVADDAGVTRRLVGRLLEELSVRVVAYAVDGVEAVRHCLTLNPELLISDLVMPRLTGVDVIRLVKSRLPVQIVVVTSHCDKAMHARCLALGASGVLIKPVTGVDLLQVLSPLWGPDKPPR